MDPDWKGNLVNRPIVQPLTPKKEVNPPEPLIVPRIIFSRPPAFCKIDEIEREFKRYGGYISSSNRERFSKAREV